jgi:hypothetical protein
MLQGSPCAGRLSTAGAGPLLLIASFLVCAVTPAHADLADELQAALNDLRGDEFTGSFGLTVSGVDISVDVLGFAFCAPPDPTAPPASNPSPPLNVYGCQNAAEVTVGPADGDTLLVGVSVAEMFADLYVTRDRTILCGEFGAGTQAADAYLLASVSAQARVRTELLEGCPVYRLVPGSVQLSLGSLDLQSEDSCATLMASLVGFLEPFLESEVTSQIESILVTALRQRNHAVCGEVPAPATTWGSLKAGFGGR